MIADPRYYLIVVVLFAAAFFLQPSAAAVSVGLIYQINSGALMRWFQLYAPFRKWCAGVGLAASLFAPTVFGVQPIILAPLAVTWFLLVFADVRELVRLASGVDDCRVSERAGKDK